MSVRRAQDERIEGTPDGNTAITEISDVPDAPTIGAIADPGPDGSGTVAFTAAATGGTVTTYTATSTPGTITGTSATSPITVTGLTLDTAYTFKVKGTNSTATGPESSASASFTPVTHDAYFPIATTTLATSASTITFSSIPAIYTHLQLRVTMRMTRTGQSEGTAVIKVNSDATTGNYRSHTMGGYGAGTEFGDYSGIAGLYGVTAAATTATSGIMGVSIVDILDYANTNKYKTSRMLVGDDLNGSGTLRVYGGVWMSTSAITQLDIIPYYGTAFELYSTFTLYGIKGA